MSDENKEKSLLAGLLLGLVSGAIFTLLYTPKKGSEVREELLSKADGLPDEVNKLLADLKDLYKKSSELVISTSKEKYGKLKAAGEETATKLKAAGEETAGKLKEAGEHQYGKLKEALVVADQTIKEKVFTSNNHNHQETKKEDA